MKKYFQLILSLLIISSSWPLIANKTIEELLIAAQDGDEIAQNEAALYYLDNKQFSKSYHWLKKASENNLAVSQYNMGILYYKGLGVKTDIDETVKWFRKSAKQNYAPAQHNLGLLLISGKDIKKNIKEGLKWLKCAALQNYAAAQYQLGILYLENSSELKKNKSLAFKFLKKAAQQKYVKAIYTLGSIYHNGKEVKQDIEKAYSYYEQAALLGDKNSLELLAKYKDSQF